MFTDYIDQLYYGELNPRRDSLPPESKTLCDDAIGYARGMSLAAFRCGFALGAKLMREIDET